MLKFPATLGPDLRSVSLEEVKERQGDPPWHERVVACEQFMLTVICQNPGHRNDRHFHLVDECWYVAEGEIVWHFEDRQDRRTTSFRTALTVFISIQTEVQLSPTQ